MNIFERVERLQLPVGQYVVFGSGPLEAHGIRETRDTDILVTQELFEKLAVDKSKFELKLWKNGDRYLYGEEGDYEITDTWNYPPYSVEPEDLIARAELIKDLPFAPLLDVLAWKKAFGREKDQRDVILIENYLRKL